MGLFSLKLAYMGLCPRTPEVYPPQDIRWIISENERQRSADTSPFSTVLSAARVKVAPQRCLIGLLTKF